MPDTIRIPVTATYRIIDGVAVRIAAEYADVSVDAVARFLLDAFGISVEGRDTLGVVKKPRGRW